MTNSAPDPAHYQKLKLLSRSRSPKRGRVKEKMISWFEKNYKVSLAITILIAIAMFYISSLTFGGVGEKGGTNLIAILYHILAYFFLALFFGFTLIKGKYKSFFIIVILFVSFKNNDFDVENKNNAWNLSPLTIALKAGKLHMYPTTLIWGLGKAALNGSRHGGKEAIIRIPFEFIKNNGAYIAGYLILNKVGKNNNDCRRPRS